jgi:hypothetical protein
MKAWMLSSAIVIRPRPMVAMHMKKIKDNVGMHVVGRA